MDKRLVLRDNNEFRRVYSRGTSKAGPVLVTYVMKSRDPAVRFGITTSRKIGSAVERNRARRVIKAALHELKNRISGGYDIVFVARSRTCFVKSTVIRGEMEKQLKEAGVLH